MGIEEYLRPKWSKATAEKLAANTNYYNLYIYVYEIQYDWSRKHKSTILHIDGCLNDESWTPVHLQMAGFNPHFYLKFPDIGMNDVQQKAFLDQLDSKLKHKLSEASKKSQSGKLTSTLFNIYSEQRKGSDKRKRYSKNYEDRESSSNFGEEGAVEDAFPNLFDDENEEDDSDGRESKRLDEKDYEDMICDNKMPLVLGYEKCETMPLLYWQPKPDNVYNITVAHPKLVKELRELILELNPMIRLFDVTTDFVIRYLADNQIYPCSWYRLDRQSYYRIPNINSEKYTRPNTVEFFVANYKSFKHVPQLEPAHFFKTLDPHESKQLHKELNEDKSIKTKEEFLEIKTKKYLSSLIPDFLVLCFDIECKTGEHRFPTPERDPVILITVQLYRLFGQKRKGGVQSIAFSLGSVKKVPTVQKTICVDKEKDLFIAFRHFFLETDPDICQHHNGNGFDFKYLFARAMLKGIDLKDFRYLGRAAKHPAYRQETVNKGWKKSTTRIPCRMNVDTLRIAQDYIPAFLECKLDYLGGFLLNERKEELLPAMIGKYFETEEGRTKILSYGMKDVDLTRRIGDKLKSILDTLEVSRAVALPFQTCLDRAQGAKMEAKLYQRMNSRDLKYQYVFEFRSKLVLNKRQRLEELNGEKSFIVPENAGDKVVPNSLTQLFQQQSKILLNVPIPKTSAPIQKSTTQPSLINNQSLQNTTTRSVGTTSFVTTQPSLINKQSLQNTTTSKKKSAAEKQQKKDDDHLEEDEGYEGAAVLKTKGGFYGYTDYDWVRKNWNATVGVLLYLFSHPVITLDFASMYPTIIMLLNLCFTTLLKEEDIIKYNLKENEDYERSPKYIENEEKKVVEIVPDPNGSAFVTKKLRRGLLPSTEEDLGKDRKAAKELKKEADTKVTELTKKLKQYWAPEKLIGVKNLGYYWFYQNIDSIIKATNNSKEDILVIIFELDEYETVAVVYDRRQDKIKAIMNSIYGLTGDPTSKFYCKQIAARVTSKGRSMIHTIRFAAETKFTKANGYPFDSEIIGGDTDSIFVHLKGLGLKWIAADLIPAGDKYKKDEFVSLADLPGKPTLYLKDAFEYGVEMAAEITKLFQKPCQLEFEKIVVNHNNMKAKNYFGLKAMLDPNETKYKDFVKGLQSKKRGQPNYVKNTAKKVIDFIALESNIQKAVDYSRKSVEKLIDGDVSITDLAVVQKLSKSPYEYDTNPPAVVLARQRMEKDPTDKIEAGEIIKYVLVDHNRVYHVQKKDVKRSEQAMEPLEAMLRDVPLDINSYKEMIEGQLYRLLHYPLRRILAEQIEQEKAMGIYKGDSTKEGFKYPNLEMTKENVEVIKKAVLSYVYRDNPSLLNKNFRSKITSSELNDKSNILSYAIVEYCMGCNNVVKINKKAGEKPFCKECLVHLPEIQKRLLQTKKELDEKSKAVWKKCDECMQGNVEDAKVCMNMACDVRGDRFLLEKKLALVSKQLDSF